MAQRFFFTVEDWQQYRTIWVFFEPLKFIHVFSSDVFHFCSWIASLTLWIKKEMKILVLKLWLIEQFAPTLWQEDHRHKLTVSLFLSIFFIRIQNFFLSSSMFLRSVTSCFPFRLFFVFLSVSSLFLLSVSSLFLLSVKWQYLFSPFSQAIAHLYVCLTRLHSSSYKRENFIHYFGHYSILFSCLRLFFLC